MYNHYKDCKDIGSYLCGDRIIDVVAFQKVIVKHFLKTSFDDKILVTQTYIPDSM